MKAGKLKYRYLFVWAVILLPFTELVQALESTEEGSMTAIVAGVQKLCGGSGSGVDITVKGTGGLNASKVISLVVNGKLEGSATLSSSEWDGVRAVRDDAKSYIQCVQSLTPLFIDKFQKKNSQR